MNAPRRRRVLMVAFHFPPFQGSSGIQRTLRFVQQLPAHGWEPVVLTAKAHAYESTAEDLIAEVPAGIRVARATAPDCARHFAIRGRYPNFLARPDRWRFWAHFATRLGRRLIDEMKPDAIWSTYPIATAHSIGSALQRASGLPWIADFRDPMAQDGYPADPITWQRFREIEQQAINRAARCVFVTRGARSMYAQRYGAEAARRFELLENGYDESSFSAVERSERPISQPPGDRPTTIVHSGIVYPSERDPTALFDALARLKRQGTLASGRFRIRFRASGHDETLRRLGELAGIADLIEIAEPLPYRDALREMLAADGLLLMQGANCADQIPGKLYEYLRARRPILGLADRRGDTGAALLAAGVSHVASLEDADAIADAVEHFCRELSSGKPSLPTEAAVASSSRAARTAQLAELLTAITA
jgi:hypothetical protein